MLSAGATRADHVVDQRRQAVGLTDDDARVFTLRRVAEFAIQQLRRAAQAADGVFDLVCQLPDHQSAAIDVRQDVVLA